MPDQTVANLLTIAIDREDDCAIVQCSGRLVAGVNDRLQSRGHPTDSGSQTHPVGHDGPHPHGQHGPGHAGPAVCFRKIGGLRLATLQHWEAGPATAWPYPSFVGIRSGRQQQHPVRIIHLGLLCTFNFAAKGFDLRRRPQGQILNRKRRKGLAKDAKKIRV